MARIPPAILCIGRNYADHAAEMKGDVPERPVVFMKNPASVIGNGEAIVIPPICREPQPQVDYEGELAVIIGAELSRGTTLLAGTVLLTGTPAGVGAARTPPRFLRDGDVVEITIVGVGTLRNPVHA